MTNARFSTENFDIAVVGGGPAGLTAALAFADAGCRTLLVAPAAEPPATGREARTAALFHTSLSLLARVGAWPACRNASAPLAGIRIIDRTESPLGLTAPEVLFEASEIGLETFGYNVPNWAMMAALRDAIAARPANLTVLDDHVVTGLRVVDQTVEISIDGKPFATARVIAAADGRHSTSRMAAGITADVRDTGQTAITAVISHTRDHHGISTEFHRAAGPCTVVPLPRAADGSYASSLVWIERTPVADRLLKLPDDAFLQSLAAQLTGVIGALTGVSARARFDLAFCRASMLAQNRVLLLAEAAHAMPPIGAQGLNLSLRDVAAAVDLVSSAVAEGRNPGSNDVLAAYQRARQRDITARMGAVETLNGSLLMDFGPVNLLRGAGLHALRAVPMLKRQVMRAGLA